MAPIVTAAELWRSWVEMGAVRPLDYDSDIVEALAPLLGPAEGLDAGTVDQRLADDGVSARDLLRAVTPLLTSFAGMMRDLLALYTRVGARSATGENLHSQFEFEDGNAVDDSLAAFRDEVKTLETAVMTLPQLHSRASWAWQGPWKLYRNVETEFSRTAHSAADKVVWMGADVLERPSETGHRDVDDVVSQWWHLIGTCKEVLAATADDHRGMLEWLYLDRKDASQSQIELAQAATDYWPASQIVAVHTLAEWTRRGNRPSVDEINALTEWLEGFWRDAPIEVSVRCLADLLSLPSWGRRHELYAAWVLTQLDVALEGRLNLEVVDGAIRFPFSPTKIATLEIADDHGRPRPIELWSEFRSPADDVVGKGRKNAVQPDYQFRAFGAAVDDAILAVEVKQYLRSALRNPGQALRDYALALPSADIIIVAHGPLSPRVTTLTPKEAADRVSAFPHVRPTVPSRCEELRAAVAELLPPPPPPPNRLPSPTYKATHSPVDQPPSPGGEQAPRHQLFPRWADGPEDVHVELRWRVTVRDLDLHADRVGSDEQVSFTNMTENWGQLQDDAFEGGPERFTLRPTTDDVRLTVRVYTGAVSIRKAGAVVDVTARNITVRLVPRSGLSREWHVGDLKPDGRFVLSAETVAGN